MSLHLLLHLHITAQCIADHLNLHLSYHMLLHTHIAGHWFTICPYIYSTVHWYHTHTICSLHMSYHLSYHMLLHTLHSHWFTICSITCSNICHYIYRTTHWLTICPYIYSTNQWRMVCKMKALLRVGEPNSDPFYNSGISKAEIESAPALLVQRTRISP